MSAETLRRAAVLMRERAEAGASWHPSVALAVAGLLDQIAGDQELLDQGVAWSTSIFWDAAKHRALDVARAYLGEQP